MLRNRERKFVLLKNKRWLTRVLRMTIFTSKMYLLLRDNCHLPQTKNLVILTLPLSRKVHHKNQLPNPKPKQLNLRSLLSQRGRLLTNRTKKLRKRRLITYLSLPMNSTMRNIWKISKFVKHLMPLRSVWTK